MAKLTSKTGLDEMDQLEQHITMIREEIQSLKAEGLTTGTNLPVLKRTRKEKLERELQNLLQRRKSLKKEASQPNQPVDEYSIWTSVSLLLHAQECPPHGQYIRIDPFFTNHSKD